MLLNKKAQEEANRRRQSLYDQGLSDIEIGLQDNVAAATVAQWRLRRGLPPNYEQGGHKVKVDYASYHGHHCPTCGQLGDIARMVDGTLTVRCPDCKVRWTTVSGTCPVCGLPNRFFADGMCITCYTIKHEENKIK